MKHLAIIITTFILSTNVLFTQTLDTEKIDLYPQKYTFEKAIWFYINLFPENKDKVVAIVKNLETELDTIDMSKLIKKSFALYGTLDPTITSFENGAPIMNMSMLKMKGAWGDELIQKIYDPNKSLSTSSQYNLRGLKKANSGDFKGAIEDFNKAIEINPNGQVYYNRAYSKSMIKDFNGAILDYDKTIELKYRLAKAYFERGFCKDQLNNPEGAIEDYTKAIETNNKYADAYNNRAFTKLKQKNYKAAIKDFDKAIRLRPDFAAAYVNRGFAKKELGNKSGACKDWKKAVELGYYQAQQFINENCN